MNKIWTKIGLIISGILAVASSLLPLSTYDGETIGTFTSDGSATPVIIAGVLVALLSVAAIVLKKKGFNTATGIVGILSAIVIAVVSIFGFMSVNQMNSYASAYTSEGLSFGMGLILMVISAAMVGLFSILTLAKNRED